MANTNNYFSMEAATQGSDAQSGQGGDYQQWCMQGYTSGIQNTQGASFNSTAAGMSQQGRIVYHPEASGGLQQQQQIIPFVRKGPVDMGQLMHSPPTLGGEGQQRMGSQFTGFDERAHFRSDVPQADRQGIADAMDLTFW